MQPDSTGLREREANVGAKPFQRLAIFGWLTAVLVLGADQLTKWWALSVMHVNEHAAIVVTSFFNLVLVHNRGVSFGMLSTSSAIMPWVLKALALGIMAVLVRWLHRSTNRLTALALGLVLGGAAGNVIDRARLGAVVDFLDFHLAGYHWPAFNVADAAICCGVLLLLFDSLFCSKQRT